MLKKNLPETIRTFLSNHSCLLSVCFIDEKVQSKIDQVLKLKTVFTNVTINFGFFLVTLQSKHRGISILQKNNIAK